MKRRSPRDSLFAQPRDMLVDFTFDEQVTKVFPDMIRRSVPGYSEMIAFAGLFAERYAQEGSHCYDLGCSLGATTLAMRRRLHARDCRIIAVDSSGPMVERCRENVRADKGGSAPVDVVLADIRDIPVEKASLVAINFTLQFIPPQERLTVLTRIHEGMLPGGVLLLAEKILFEDPDEQAFQESMHLAFKRANGYSELEISQKRAALERVLIPDTVAVHRQRLQAAGFGRTHVWFRCFNFAGLAAFT